MSRKKNKFKDLDWNMSAYEQLSLDDLSNIINRYRYRLIDLKRLYNKKKLEEELEYILSENDTTNTIRMMAKVLLDIFGFTKNKIYKKEVEFISEKLVDKFHWDKPHGPYSNEMMSTCIVGMIFEYYDVKYDEDELISIYGIDKKKYGVLYRKCMKWLKKKYWK